MTLDPTQLRGATVVDAAGQKVGSVREIYLDNDTGVAEWALVHTGLLGTRSTFVPLAEAVHDGGSIQVPYTKHQIEGAPNLDEGGRLSGTAEAELYAFYGLIYSETNSGSGLPEGAPGLAHRTEGAAMTRSEEELRVGTESVESGRVRLRKWVETEPIETEVHARRETAVIERQPVNQPVAGVAMGEAEIEVPLLREEPVLEKRTVAKERIELVKGVRTDQETVAAELRKERIDVEDSTEQR